jgi:hypothetical protein
MWKQAAEHEVAAKVYIVDCSSGTLTLVCSSITTYRASLSVSVSVSRTLNTLSSFPD